MLGLKMENSDKEWETSSSSCCWVGVSFWPIIYFAIKVQNAGRLLISGAAKIVQSPKMGNCWGTATAAKD
jgi:hypothetical protein